MKWRFASSRRPSRWRIRPTRQVRLPVPGREGEDPLERLARLGPPRLEEDQPEVEEERDGVGVGDEEPAGDPLGLLEVPEVEHREREVREDLRVVRPEAPRLLELAPGVVVEALAQVLLAPVQVEEEETVVEEGGASRRLGSARAHRFAATRPRTGDRPSPGGDVAEVRDQEDAVAAVELHRRARDAAARKRVGIPLNPPERTGAAAAPAVDEHRAPHVLLRLGVGRNAPVPLHGALAGVVGGERPDEVAVEHPEEVGEVGRAAADVLVRVEGVPDAVAPRGAGHQLHQPAGPLRGDRPRVEVRLDEHDALHETRVDAARARRAGGSPRRTASPRRAARGGRSRTGPSRRPSSRSRCC